MISKNLNQNSGFYQHFCGCRVFTPSFPCNATEPVHFRHRIGEKGIELIFWESIRVNNDDLSGKGDKTAFIDSAVQEKNITYPTESKLHRKIIYFFGKCYKLNVIYLKICINKSISRRSNLKTDKPIDLEKFDTVILGTAVYAGTPLQAMKKFCAAQSDVLPKKRLGLFICGMEQNEEKQQTETAGAFPQSLREKAVATAFLGGEFLFEEMNFLEKMIIRKIAKTDKSVSAIKEDRIEEFVRLFN